MNHSLWTADAATFRKVLGTAAVAATIIFAIGLTMRDTSRDGNLGRHQASVRAEHLLIREHAILVSSLN